MSNKEHLILAINPGSTSTKIGIFFNEKEIFHRSIEHSVEELSHFTKVVDQYEMRKKAVLNCLEENNIKVQQLSAIVARGGALPPVDGGAYFVNQNMLDLLRSGKLSEHVSNVAAIIAYDMATPIGIPALIYDAISTFELSKVAEISGMPALPRDSLSHTLNTKAVSRKVAAEMNKTYGESTFIVAHLGGGISVSLHNNGRMIEIISDDEGPFSPERAGRVPCRLLIEMCYSGKYEYQVMRRMLRGKGGLVGYLGTNNAREVEKRIEAGDEYAKLIYYAMAYQIAKAIGDLATVVKGKVDRIILTGGVAYSQMLTNWIKEYVEFLAPITVVPGENELESLALGALRVIRGEEKAQEFSLKV